MTAMDITIHQAYLPQDDPDAALAFYRDTLGFEVRNDVDYRGLRWITVGPAGQPGTSIVLHPPGADPGITDDERRTIAEMMAKGTYAGIDLATRDLDATFERLQAARRRCRPGADRPAMGGPRLRRPRSRGQPHPDPGAALSHPAIELSRMLRVPAQALPPPVSNDRPCAVAPPRAGRCRPRSSRRC